MHHINYSSLVIYDLHTYSWGKIYIHICCNIGYVTVCCSFFAGITFFLINLKDLVRLGNIPDISNTELTTVKDYSTYSVKTYLFYWFSIMCTIIYPKISGRRVGSWFYSEHISAVVQALAMFQFLFLHLTS